MDDEQLTQRIKYLVEHGGLYDDPLGDIRRYARTNRLLICATLALSVANILLH